MTQCNIDRRTCVQALVLGGLDLLPRRRTAMHPARPPIEINLAGYENTGARYGYDFVLPSDATLRYFLGRRISTIRLPIYWNRLQPSVGGALSEPDAVVLEAFLRRARALSVRVIADLHGFGGRDGARLGSPTLPIKALASFWDAFARRFRGLCHGYDLMNEPHDMPSRTAWPEAAQLAADAIRRHDRRTWLYIEGDDWSNAERWWTTNEHLDIRDPVDRVIYSAHIYFDADTSGQYRNGYEADPDIGARRLAPFVRWLRVRGFRGHIGEFGAPYADPRWITVLDRFVTAVAEDRDVLTGAAYWAAGEWMDFYNLTLQPTKADGRWIDRPQLEELLRPR